MRRGPGIRCTPGPWRGAASAGGGVAEPRAGPDVRHAPARDPRGRGDLRREAEGAVDLRLPSPGRPCGGGPGGSRAGRVPAGHGSPRGPLTGRRAGGPAASRWRSRARRSGGPRRWAWPSRGWRKATRTPSKTTTRSRCAARGPPFPPAGSPRPWQPPRSRPGGAPSQIGNFNFLSGNHQMLLHAFFLKKDACLEI